MGGRGGYGGKNHPANYAGVTIATKGKAVTYFLRNGQLQNSQTLQFVPGNGTEQLQRIISAGGTPLTKMEVQSLVNARNDRRASTPDYETGNPFNERGKGKTVYRPRMRKH